MSTSTQCLDCKHYNSFSTCDAFPDKIPQEIFDGRVIHDVPYEGDGGIMYDPIDTELSADQMVEVVKILDDKGLLKFEIPDELLEAIDIDPKKMSPDQIKRFLIKLKEKGLFDLDDSDKPESNNEFNDESSDESEDTPTIVGLNKPDSDDKDSDKDDKDDKDDKEKLKNDKGEE